MDKDNHKECASNKLAIKRRKKYKKFAILVVWWDLHIYEHFSSWTHLKCGQTGSMKAPFVNFESNAAAFHNLNWKVAMKSTSSKESKMEILIRGNLINANRNEFSFRFASSWVLKQSTFINLANFADVNVLIQQLKVYVYLPTKFLFATLGWTDRLAKVLSLWALGFSSVDSS